MSSNPWDLLCVTFICSCSIARPCVCASIHWVIHQVEQSFCAICFGDPITSTYIEESLALVNASAVPVPIEFVSIVNSASVSCIAVLARHGGDGLLYAAYAGPWTVAKASWLVFSFASVFNFQFRVISPRSLSAFNGLRSWYAVLFSWGCLVEHAEWLSPSLVSSLVRSSIMPPCSNFAHANCCFCTCDL